MLTYICQVLIEYGHPGQLSLAIPPWLGAMSTGDGYDHR